MTSVEGLARLAGECCGDRCPVPMPDAAVSSHHHMLGALAMSASSIIMVSNALLLRREVPPS
ncbi:MAG TPA: hypothetical protein VK898_04745 [Chloroflexota bacterium]|nr:hypothetical protein [Chloroflexota bacterium]